MQLPPYTIQKSSRRRTIQIIIRPDLSVKILAPLSISDHRIQEFFTKKASWIISSIEKLRQRTTKQPSQLQYIDGETLNYLGQQYCLKIHADRKNCITINEELRTIDLFYKKPESIKLILELGFKERAQVIFQQRLIICHLKFMKIINCHLPTLKIRKMTSRWGSMSYNSLGIYSANKMTLNSTLIHYPVDIIDYIIFHELCHIKHHNHSKRFYNLLEKVMPDWKEKKVQLRYNALHEQHKID